MNPAEWLARAATRGPDAVAFMTGATPTADYRSFARRAQAIGGALRERYGVSPGDPVAVFMTNRTEYLEALYGAWWAGAAAVPVNAKLHAKEAAWTVEHAGASVVFASDARRRDSPERIADIVRGE
ncbi:MAG: AMP-binding protein, partial [Pseudomonadota bacterium]